MDIFTFAGQYREKQVLVTSVLIANPFAFFSKVANKYIKVVKSLFNSRITAFIEQSRHLEQNSV